MFNLRALILILLVMAPGWAISQTPDDETSIEGELDDPIVDPASEQKMAPPPPAATENDVPASKPTEAKPTELTPAPANRAEEPPAEKFEEPLSAPSEPQRKGHTESLYDGGTRKRSANQGQPIFDWSKHQGEREVKHPFAEKGLIRITKGRQYIYKVKESEQTRAISFHAGIFHPKQLRNPDVETNATYDDNYPAAKNNPFFMLDYEWQLWRSPIGKWGARLGSGFFIAQGNGHFVKSNTSLTPREVFTFVLVPVNLGAIYRLQIWNKQFLVPYGEGGVTGNLFSEFRDDGKSPKFGGSPGAYFGAGAALNLTYFDVLSRIQLDRQYGINAVYLTAEFRQTLALSNRYDFTASVINGGFLLEY